MNTRRSVLESQKYVDYLFLNKLSFFFSLALENGTFPSEWKRIEISTFMIDLIFANQPNLVMGSGVHPSLYPNCYHQIVFAIFNLKTFYTPLYERDIWHYWKANTDHANEDVNEKVILLNKIIANIPLIYIPQEIIFCGDRDFWWMKN